jgi:hypothetical protein
MKTRTYLRPSKRARPLKFKKQLSGPRKYQRKMKDIGTIEKVPFLFVAVELNVCSNFCAKNRSNSNGSKEDLQLMDGSANAEISMSLRLP